MTPPVSYEINIHMRLDFFDNLSIRVINNLSDETDMCQMKVSKKFINKHIKTEFKQLFRSDVIIEIRNKLTDIIWLPIKIFFLIKKIY